MFVAKQKPYYDDYDENKKFLKTLFIAGRPLQAREATQIQTQLQAQIERFGNHQFKAGARVLDGELSFDTEISYIKVTTTLRDPTVLIGRTLTGLTSHAKGTIVHVDFAEGDDPVTFYVRFVAGGDQQKEGVKSTGTGYTRWAPGEQFEETSSVTILDSDDSVGASSIAQIERGIYYVKGYFVLVDQQTLVLDKYGNVPSYRIGLQISESVVTPEEDRSLLDNAIGSYNYAAPGAHRYKMELTLAKVDLASKVDNDKFIELGQIQAGRIVKTQTKTEYNELEKTLARRTYDESGDYTVRPFKACVREHRNNDRGQWKANAHYLIGDIVRNHGKMYTARSEGRSPVGDGPNWDSGKNSDGAVWWEQTANPKYNNGVYPAEGRVISIEVVDGGNGYITPPRVEIESVSGRGAQATAVVSGGKVVRVMIDHYGSGYLYDDVIIKFQGGHGSINGCVCPDESGKLPVSATARAITDAGDPNLLAIGLESGKAYVRGFEIEKVGTSWITMEKARETAAKNSVLLTPNVGSYIRVTNIKGIPPLEGTDKAGVLDIYDVMTEEQGDIKIGTCSFRGIEWDSGDRGDSTDTYRLYINDFKLEKGFNITNGIKSFKSVKSGGIGQQNFTCDIAPILTKLTGSITAADGKITGSGTSFRTELINGDYIFADGKYFQVNTINGQNEISTTSKQACKNVVGYLCTTTIFNPQGTSSIYRYPDTWVKSLINSEQDDNFDIDYVTMELLTGSTNNSGDKIEVTFTSPGSNVSFTNGQERDNYIMFAGDEIVPFSVQQTISAGRTLTVFIDKKYNGRDCRLLATLRKTGGATGLRTKTSTQHKVYVTNLNELKQSNISLRLADVYRIVSVRMYTNSTAGTDDTPQSSVDESGPYVDITDRFDLDTGQTDSFYNLSSLRLKNGYSAPTNPIVVDLYYFKHGREGDYFTVDSYDIPYEEIPSYNGYNLRDMIDFRPSVAGNASRVFMIKSGTEIEVGYRYYLARRDRLCLDYQGNFVAVKGIASANPQQPQIPNMAMPIYNIDLQPYTLDASNTSVVVNMVDNRRYTMRDIGKLEARIDRLEEYTALSLLEQQTESMNIQDSSGMDRFKQGFIVDNFQSGSIASVNDTNIACSIDNENGVCRPPFMQNNYTLTEYAPKGATINNYRASNNYMMYGKVFTLPLDPANPHIPIVEQPLATRIQNINPFAIAAFIGSLTVNPSSDDWFDVEYAPDVVTQVEGDYLEKKNILEGTKWNIWQNQWYGQPTTTTTTQSTGWRGQYEIFTDTSVTSQQIGQSREGIKTTVTSKIDYEVVGDRIVATSSIPYMRSRWLLIKARNLKPYTRYYPFFDNVQVDYWCVPASRVEFKPGTVTGEGFDGWTAAGVDAKNDARKIISTKYSYWPEETDRTCLDIGDVITAYDGDRNVTKMSAVCVGYGHGPSESSAGAAAKVVDYMYVVNMKNGDGTAIQGNSGSADTENADGLTMKGLTVRGSISGASGVVEWAQGNRNHISAPLITNAAGELYFMFWIPNGDKIDHSKSENQSPVFQFRCGERVFSLSEKSEKNTFDAEVVYSATGTYNKRERSVNAVRNAVVSTQYVREDRTVTNTTNVTSKERAVYRDPLAQTFLIGTPGGCFLSKVDIYFATVPGDDNPLPVTLQIRTVENGIPTSKVLPFSEVTLRPDQIKLSSETVEYVDADGQVVKAAKYDTPTTFVFESPVYCEDTSEYAVVLLSDSNDYNVWIAQVGELVPGTSNLVSKQPYTGVLLKSQNASTWTPDQTQDLMMTVYRANFHIADNETNPKESLRIGNLQFAVDGSKPQYLAKNCFQTTNKSTIVRVYHPNHGLVAGCKAVISREDVNDVDSTNYLTGTIRTVQSSLTVQGTGTRFRHEIRKVRDNSGNDVWPVLFGPDHRRVGQIASIESDTLLTLAEDSFEDEDEQGADIELEDAQFSVQTNEPMIGGSIPYEKIIGEFEILDFNITKDSYLIDLVSTGVDVTKIKAGFSGDGKFKAEGIFNYTTIHPNFNTQTFGDTAFNMTIKAVPGTENGVNNQSLTSPFGVVMNDNNTLGTPMAIWNKANLMSTIDSSLIVNVTFASTNPALTPVIDSDRISVLVVNNLIDNPTEKDYNNDEMDVSQVTSNNNFGYYGRITKVEMIDSGNGYNGTPTVTISAPTIGDKGIQATARAIVNEGKITSIVIDNEGAGYVDDPDKAPRITIKPTDGGTGASAKLILTKDLIIADDENDDNLKVFSDIKIGQYIELAKKATYHLSFLIKNKQVTDKSVIYHVEGDTSQLKMGQVDEGTTMNVRVRYTDEICPTGGSTHAKYITRPISLANTCNMAKIMFAACVPKMSDLDVYCKTYSASDSLQYNDVPWIKLNASKGYSNVDIGQVKFTDVEYLYDMDTSFDTIAVKVVFRSHSTASAPMIKDFRVIGCI